MPTDHKPRAKRAPRFSRVLAPKPTHLTDRDYAILHSFKDASVQNSAQIAQRIAPDAAPCPRCHGDGILLVGAHIRSCVACGGLRFKGHRKIVKRLARLFHNGLLDRPLAQLIVHRAGSSRIVYRLTSQGASALRAKGIQIPRSRHNQLNKNVKHEFLEHKVGVADYATHLMAAAHAYPTIGLVSGPDLLGRINAWRAAQPTAQAADTGATPDRSLSAFKLRCRHTPPGSTIKQWITAVADNAFLITHTGRDHHFFHEHDTGSEQIDYRRLRRYTHSSILAKAYAYGLAHSLGLAGSQLGWPGFHVLFETSTPDRAQHIRDKIAADPNILDKHIFWVTDRQSLATTRFVSNDLEHVWITADSKKRKLAPGDIVPVIPRATPLVATTA